MANCTDATLTNYPDCFNNVTWAMTTGIKQTPMWYADYPILSEQNDFKAFQWVLNKKVGPGTAEADTNGKPDGPGYGCPLPCDVVPPSCYNINQDSPGQCYENTLWAMQTGINDDPQYYTDFPKLTNASSFNDFQYVLHKKVTQGNDGPGWQCPMPCTSGMFIPTTSLTSPTTTMQREITTVAPPTTSTTSTTTMTTTTTEPSSSSSFPWWAWALLVAGLLVVGVGIAAYFLSQKKEAPKKKKRAVPAPQKKSTSPPAPAPPVTPAQPVYTQMAQPVQPVVTSPPVYARAAAQPVYTAAPVQAVQTAVPVAQAMPTQAYAYAAPPAQQAAALFDQLDVNHDGVITRAEFARVMNR